MRAFIITIDTEGDHIWSRPRAATTHNARFLPRFQRLCERHGFKPTYLTNHEMASCPVFQEFGGDVIARGAGEIGMHLHAWDSPPIVPLGDDDALTHPYLFEFPESLVREKVARMTDLLTETFDVRVISHRAGRWGLNETYARVLVDHGYSVDCSVTPLLSWRSSMGDPRGCGGPDYHGFPDRAYFVDLDDVSRAGDSPLLEVPLTVLGPRSPTARALHDLMRHGPRMCRGVLFRLIPPTNRLVPNGTNLGRMLSIVRRGRDEGRDYLEFALHSSEVMPGGSARFVSERDVDALYDQLEMLFSVASRSFTGATLADYHRYVIETRAGAGNAARVGSAGDLSAPLAITAP